MTKADAINTLGSAARFSKTMTTDDFAKLFRLAASLQDDYRAAKKPKERADAERFYFGLLRNIDAHLTLIDK